MDKPNYAEYRSLIPASPMLGFRMLGVCLIGLFFFLVCFACIPRNHELDQFFDRIDQTVWEKTLQESYFQVFAPQEIYADEVFYITVNCIHVPTNRLLAEYNQEVSWEVYGTGTLSVIHEQGWQDGTNVFTLKYTKALALGESETIFFQIKDAGFDYPKGDTSADESSSGTLVYPPAKRRFEIEMKEGIYPNESFNVTIQALGRNNGADTTYRGTVRISITGGETDPAPFETSNFIDGVLTISDLSYASHAHELVLHVEDIENAEMYGDKTFQVGTGLGTNFHLNVHAVSLNPKSIRITWNKTDAAQSFVLYYASAIPDTQSEEEESDAETDSENISENTPETISDIHYSELITLDNSIDYYIHEDIFINTTYYYKLVALDADAKVIGTGYASSMPQVCTPKSSSITESVTWTKEDSPYCITQTLQISNTLTIEPGVTILLGSEVQLAVIEGGSIIAEGTMDEPIVFTASSVDTVDEYWQGISIKGTTTGSTINEDHEYVSGTVFKHVLVEYARQAIESYLPLYIEACIFRHCTHDAFPAGVMLSSPNETSVITHSLFCENIGVADSFGSGIALFKGSAYIHQNTFEENYANKGAAIYIDSKATASISKNVFYKNKALYYGGALNIGGDEVSIKQNTFQENEAARGAGIFFFGTSDCLVEENDFSYNHAKDNGGAIASDYSTTAAVFRNNLLEYNTSNSSGGGIFFTSADTIDFEENRFQYNESVKGGALCITESSDITISNNHLEMNKASNGASMYFDTVNDSLVDQNQIQNNEASNSTAGFYGYYIYNCTLSNNTFLDNTATFGAGIMLYLEAEDNTITKNTFTNNYSSQGGAAIYLDEVSTNTISQNVFKNNSNRDYAAIMIEGTELTTIDDNQFEENTSVSGSGALYIDSNSQQTQVTNNTFTKNSTKKSGGAILLGGNQTTIQSNTFSENSAETNGGALVLSYAHFNTISENTVTNNQAVKGGGVYLYASYNNTFSENTFSNNTASENGGGGYISTSDSQSTNTWNDNVFDGNQAESGGGAYIPDSNGAMYLTDNKFSNNQAESCAGIRAPDSTNAILQSNVYTANQATDGTHNCLPDLKVITISSYDELPPTLPGFSFLARFNYPVSNLDTSINVTGVGSLQSTSLSSETDYTITIDSLSPGTCTVTFTTSLESTSGLTLASPYSNDTLIGYSEDLDITHNPTGDANVSVTGTEPNWSLDFASGASVSKRYFFNPGSPCSGWGFSGNTYIVRLDLTALSSGPYSTIEVSTCASGHDTTLQIGTTAGGSDVAVADDQCGGTCGEPYGAWTSTPASIPGPATELFITFMGYDHSFAQYGEEGVTITLAP